jgi:hypothetical protein
MTIDLERRWSIGSLEVIRKASSYLLWTKQSQHVSQFEPILNLKYWFGSLVQLLSHNSMYSYKVLRKMFGFIDLLKLISRSVEFKENYFV